MNTFENLGLSHESLSAIEDMGYQEPTTIQRESIPHILEGRDVIGHSKTGTGKTMAFGLPAIELVDDRSKATQVLVLCPTRELAEQATGEIKKASAYKQHLNVTAIYGGASMIPQIKQLQRGAHIVVGTPGRVMDHMRRGTLQLGELKMMVLDEADEMLNMGFREDIETVLEDVPESASMVLFSATMSRGIMQITQNYQNDAKVIKAVDDNKTVATIDQWFVFVKKMHKQLAVDVLLKYHEPKLTLIFCNTKKMVDDLTVSLQKRGVSAVALHGDLNQNARNRVMNGFRSGAMPVLVATDVAARGIDVDDVEMVINYDIPKDDEYYVHRIGRTGRAGRSGKAVSIACAGSQKKRLRDIENYIKVKIRQKPLPSKSEIIEMQQDRFVEEFIGELEKPVEDQYFKVLDSLEGKGYSIRKISATLLKMALQMEGTEDMIDVSNESRSSGAKEQNMVRFFINIGKKDNVRPGDIVGCIASKAKISGANIGKVELYDIFSFVEVEQQFKKKVLSGINKGNVKIRGSRVSIEVAKAKR